MGFVVALLLALTMPVSQLRTVMIEQSCCCPDPADCHCPDGGDGAGDQAHLEACHQDTQAHVAPVLPTFAPPALSSLPTPSLVIVSTVHVLGAPHAPPPPPRPAAPS